jgi:hypothetical protein
VVKSACLCALKRKPTALWGGGEGGHVSAVGTASAEKKGHGIDDSGSKGESSWVHLAMRSNPPSSSQSLSAGFVKLLRSAILHYGPATSQALKVMQRNLSSSACCVATKALNVAAVVQLCVPNRGLKARAAWKVYLGCLGQETWEGNDLSGPLIGSHLTFYYFSFSFPFSEIH